MDLSDPVSAVIPTLEGQVLRVLAGTTRPMTASTIARLAARGSGPGVRVALQRLVDVGTVLQDRVGRQYEYRANRDHAAWPAIQAAVDFANGFRARLDAEIGRLIHDVTAHEAPDVGWGERVTCALFGSTARGTADAESDVDLVLVIPDGVPAESGEALSEHLSERITLFTGNPVNTLLLTTGQRDEMVSRDDALVRSWRVDARTVHGPDLLPVPEGS
ncbi:nucleotidyltransferase domain-containing protein [Kineococcus glutinatus]|uniref:Polymerase nucleotidyl transferase domain-containing protein n=1 Tax=Kineococcus glutinatus TaxID=1070872 RepID=A0ABP9HHV7_9ACTN